MACVTVEGPARWPKERARVHPGETSVEITQVSGLTLVTSQHQ